ncbi:hypothetical protein Gotri_016068 [Gossypium trilobum]|uniref:Uncharacterized protein n=1 Tax=Gossypium trilobum TaxID=34281 RepID=A0A7J9E2G7_9ROSI|nr:hypothetical protein [Gossypium trilobum]
MGKPTIPKIHGHLQAAGFLHASRMSGGCKLDLQLINALCTITLKDIVLQLGLTVDGSVITGFTIISGKVSVYQSLLGKVSEKFKGGWISMNWLKDNFNELPKDLEDRTDELGVCRIVHVIPGDVLGYATKCGINRWLSAPTTIVGVVATTVSTSQGDRPIYVPVNNEVEPWAELRGTARVSKRY